MFIIFTGNGKGKTTAALGQALRAVGDGQRVLMVQFIKGPWKSGEDTSYKKLSPKFKIVKMGKGFVGIGKNPLPLRVHIQAAKEALEYATNQTRSKKWDIIILDEIWNALALDLVSTKAVSTYIQLALPLLSHLIMTGRNCPATFIKQADLVTEMREVKHPFNKGVSGTKGLEY